MQAWKGVNFRPANARARSVKLTVKIGYKSRITRKSVYCYLIFIYTLFRLYRGIEQPRYIIFIVSRYSGYDTPDIFLYRLINCDDRVY